MAKIDFYAIEAYFDNGIGIGRYIDIKNNFIYIGELKNTNLWKTQIDGQGVLINQDGTI